MAKNPRPTAANPHPATSSYLKAPKQTNRQPIKIMINVAHANTLFLFILLSLENFKSIHLNLWIANIVKLTKKPQKLTV